jgi:hypothetical protein
MSDRDKLLLPFGSIPRLEQFPDLKNVGEFDPDNLTAKDVLKVMTLVLAKTRDGADSLIFNAQFVMEEQFARGRRRGLEEGRRDGYESGYREGLEDGRREALGAIAQEEAERATLKAAAHARRETKA